MTQRRKLEQRLHSLGEIRNIINSMKTLAYMETKKLEHFLQAQLAVEKNIKDVARDFLSFYPETLAVPEAAASLYILIGSERGFCGEFNHKLLEHLESVVEVSGASLNPIIITVGQKLFTLLEGDRRVEASIDGASVVEEVNAVLLQLVDRIVSIQNQYGSIDVYCLFYGEEGDVVMQRFLPPFQGLAQCEPEYGHQPMLNMSPADFFISLTEQYLFSTLYTMLYTSFREENNIRVSHLEGAVNHLDDNAEALKQKVNALRQEDIIEEIEVILLSAASLDDTPDKQRRKV